VNVFKKCIIVQKVGCFLNINKDSCTVTKWNSTRYLLRITQTIQTFDAE